jgi:hypothetical protein
MPFSVTVTGISEVEAMLTRMAERAADMTPAMDGPVSDLIEASFLNRLANEGPGWAALAPSTQANRRRPGRGLGGIGEDTLKMYNSLINPSAEGAIKIVSPTGVSRGTDVESDRGKRYADIFHLGRRDGRQPARPLFDDESLNSLASMTETILLDHVILGAF